MAECTRAWIELGVLLALAAWVISVELRIARARKDQLSTAALVSTVSAWVMFNAGRDAMSSLQRRPHEEPDDFDDEPAIGDG